LIDNINLNGKLKPADEPFFQSDNRAFKYGDGFFETIRVFNGQIPFLNFHFNRLKATLIQLKFDVPDYFSELYFKNEIQKLIDDKGNYRVRMTFFRSNGGLYTPKNNHPQYVIESNILDNSIYQLNVKGLRLGLCDEIILPKSPLSNLKTCNSLPFVLAGLYCKESEYDDVFLLNGSGDISECVSSNVFLLKNKVISTPALTEGCVAGIMRKVVIEIAKSKQFKIEEKAIKVSDLEQADEIWLSNAIQGIRWVENFNDYRFKNNIAKDFVKLLNERIKEK